MAADPVAERLERVKNTFLRDFAQPLFDAFPDKILEFFPNDDGTVSGARTLELMVAEKASQLPQYIRLRGEFSTKVLDTRTENNLNENSIPFTADAEGDALFNELVECCYELQAAKDCRKSAAKGWYSILHRKAAVEDACIDIILGKINTKFAFVEAAGCQELLDQYRAQEAALGGAVVGGGGGGHVGGARRSRRRHRKARKNRSRRQ